MEISFGNPEYLWLLLVVIIIIFVHFYSLKHNRKKALRFSNFEAIAKITGEDVVSKNFILLGIRVIAISTLIFAVAGTMIWFSGPASDFNFVLAIDASSSMSSSDFIPSRLEVAKEEATELVNTLQAKTKIGVISFSGTSFIELEGLSNNLGDVKNAINKIEVRRIGGTNIGGAIIDSVNLLLSETKSRMIILLTDGQSNIGVPLEDAVRYALDNHVSINTIGIGSKEGSNFTEFGAVSRLDDESLKLISESTGGEYFKVLDKASLRKAYTDIAVGPTKKIPFEATNPLLLIAVLLFFAEWILASTVYSSIP